MPAIWLPFGASPFGCRFPSTLKMRGNQYDGSKRIFVTSSDMSAIDSALATQGTTQSPWNFTLNITIGSQDLLSGWAIEPCAQPKNSHAVVAAPLTF